MRRRRPGFVAILIGLGMLLLSEVQFLGMLKLPGFFVAGIFWPQGVHSSNLGPIGMRLFFVTIYAGTAAVWAAIAYGILRIAGRRRAAVGQS